MLVINGSLLGLCSSVCNYVQMNSTEQDSEYTMCILLQSFHLKGVTIMAIH